MGEGISKNDTLEIAKFLRLAISLGRRIANRAILHRPDRCFVDRPGYLFTPTV